jgi:Nucleotidyl transferase AbiEii toxin, Type IV TA system
MEYTWPATWDDAKSLAKYLSESGAEYALVGGYALAAHGFNRFTEDIDILVNPSVENSRRWITALSRQPDGAAKELASEELMYTQKETALRFESTTSSRWVSCRRYAVRPGMQSNSISCRVRSTM